MLIQAASPWPVNVAGWIELVIKALVLSGMIGGVLSWWLRIKLNGLGERVKLVEDHCIAGNVKEAGTSSKVQTLEFTMAAIHERLAEIKAILTDTKEEIAERRRLDEKSTVRTAERLARIETKLSIPSDDRSG